MGRGRVTENTEQMKEKKRERDGVDCLTGGHAQSSASVPLKVRGRDPEGHKVCGSHAPVTQTDAAGESWTLCTTV